MVFTNPIPEADDLLEQFIKKNMKKRMDEGKLKAVSSMGSSSSQRVEGNPGAEGASNKLRKIG